MEKLADIKKDLIRSDYKVIHQMSGVSLSTINAMMQGNRNSNTPSGAKVLKAAKEIIKTRQDLINPKAPKTKEPKPIALPFEGENTNRSN